MLSPGATSRRRSTRRNGPGVFRSAAWDDGLSNDILILGQRYPLSGDANSSFERVRNHVDDPSLDFIKVAPAQCIVSIPVCARKGNPTTADRIFD